jgi:catechol 2,3-dioxygenase-like lactoylglutathione lyase family enzyme
MGGSTLPVTLKSLDHVNLRTANLAAMVAWYGRVLDMHPGSRPGFDFPGAWLYADGHPFVHLIGVDEQPRGEDPTLEHFAFSANGLGVFTRRLKDLRVDFRAAKVPGTEITQINVFDPDGNHIHVDFRDEA